MNQDQAQFFQSKLLPIVREATKNRGEPHEERDTLRPMLRQLLEYTDRLAKDQNRLDKLQALTKGYGLGWLLRISSTGRGMRLAETTMIGATPDVRQAIDAFDEETGHKYPKETTNA